MTICLSSSAAATFVLPRYPIRRHDFPELDLPIKIVNRDINPASENPDFAIRLGTGAWAAVDAWPMFDKVYFPTRATLEDMSRANLLVLKEWLRPPDDWRTFFERLGQPPASRPRVDSFADQQTLLASVMDGQGVGFGWKDMSDNPLRTASLMRPVTEEVRSGRSFYLVAPKGMRGTETASAFRDWLLNEGAMIQQAENRAFNPEVPACAGRFRSRRADRLCRRARGPSCRRSPSAGP